DPTKEHPHPIVRLEYLTSYLQQIFISNDFSSSKDEFSKLMVSVIADFDITLTYVFGISDNELYYKRFKDPDVKKTENILIELIKADQYLNINTPYQK